MHERYEIQGREVRLPCVVRDASAGAATWIVPAAPARRLLPGPELELACVLPGRALLSIAMIDYRDNDLGDYAEVSIGVFARPRGERPRVPWVGSMVDLVRRRLGVYIRHLPVNQSFTCEAGCRIWGYPKTVQTIELETTPGRMRGRLVYDGEHALTLSLPRGGARTVPEGELVSYSRIEGIPHRIRAVQGASGFGIRLGGAE
ncbi:MAG: acetoacetate decarboxylase family protein, partial [Candidatus Rokuibacteriota bacterium]